MLSFLSRGHCRDSAGGWDISWVPEATPLVSHVSVRISSDALSGHADGPHGPSEIVVLIQPVSHFSVALPTWATPAPGLLPTVAP